MTDNLFPDPSEPANASRMAHLLDELQLYGHRAFDDAPDPRPLPDHVQVEGALADIFDAFVATLSDTRLEADLPDLLWALVNVFHRRIDRMQRELESNEDRQRRSQAEQDGSEVRSVDLERLIAEGLTLLERRNAFEFMRDVASDLHQTHLGQAWFPRSGSKISHRSLTAAVVDSRDFLNARRRAETEVLIPQGTRVAFAGGIDCNDHDRIWAVLDRVHTKHTDMVLLHGGTPRGAEKIAACWAEIRSIPQIVFKPNWTNHAKAAPFKRNDSLLETLPIGLIVFPGSGVTDNLADKARKLGIPLFDFRAG